MKRLEERGTVANLGSAVWPLEPLRSCCWCKKWCQDAVWRGSDLCTGAVSPMAFGLVLLAQGVSPGHSQHPVPVGQVPRHCLTPGPPQEKPGLLGLCLLMTHS